MPSTGLEATLRSSTSTIETSGLSEALMRLIVTLRRVNNGTDRSLNSALSSFSVSAQKWKPVWLSLFPQSSSGIGRLEIQDMGGTVGFSFTLTQSALLNARHTEDSFVHYNCWSHKDSPFKKQVKDAHETTSCITALHAVITTASDITNEIMSSPGDGWCNRFMLQSSALLDQSKVQMLPDTLGIILRITSKIRPTTSCSKQQFSNIVSLLRDTQLCRSIQRHKAQRGRSLSM